MISIYLEFVNILGERKQFFSKQDNFMGKKRLIFMQIADKEEKSEEKIVHLAWKNQNRKPKKSAEKARIQIKATKIAEAVFKKSKKNASIQR